MNIALRCWRKTDPVDATRNVNLQVNHLVIISLRQRLNSFISVSCHELGIKWYICVAASIRSHGLSHLISVGHFKNVTRLWWTLHAKLRLFYQAYLRNASHPHETFFLELYIIFCITHQASRPGGWGGGGGATLLCHIGMWSPKGYSFCAVSFWERE